MTKAAIIFSAAAMIMVLLCGSRVHAAGEEDTVTDSGRYAGAAAIAYIPLEEGGSMKLEVGEELFYPEELGSYSTNYFTLNGNTAYCLESALGTPASGDYAQEILDNEMIRKGLYYGMGGPGELQLFSESQIENRSAYILTHIALSYFYCGDAAFAGCTVESLENCGVWYVIRWIENAPPVPEAGISFSPSVSEAHDTGDGQMTDIITLNGDAGNAVSFQIPAEVTFHNENTGDEQKGGTVKIDGGTKFRLTASSDYAGIVDSGPLRGSMTNTWRAVMVRTGDSTQAVGSLGVASDTAAPSSFRAVWKRVVGFGKTDAESSAAVSGASFQILDSSGAVIYEFTGGGSEELVRMLPGKYILREVKAPDGYIKSADIEFTVEEGESAQKVIVKENFIRVLIEKRDSGDNSLLKGARLQLIDKQGSIAAEWTTGTEGKLLLRIKAGIYTIHEAEAPEGYEKADDMKITILDTAEEQHFIMNDIRIAAVAFESEETDRKGENSAPSTGDEQSSRFFWLFAMIAAAAAVCSCASRFSHLVNKVD